MTKKPKKKYKSVITQRINRSARKVAAILASLCLICQLGFIKGTNSEFSSGASATGDKFTAGEWIPVLTMAVDPAKPDGQNGFYVTDPCITLAASLTDTTIYYTFVSGDKTQSGTYGNSCIQVPEGEWNFSAYAIHDNNPNWKSNVVSDSFKADYNPLIVKINDPGDGDTVSGSVDIKGTVTDDYLQSYRLEINKSNGDNIYDSKDTDQSDSISDNTLYSWNTNTQDVPDGNYQIILSATDQAGRKVDDTVNVKVKNDPSQESVVINEIMWAGSAGDSGDEWLELKNTTGNDIDLSNWQIDGAGKGSGDSSHLEIPAGYSIKAHGYFLIMKEKWDQSAIKLDGDLDKDEGMTNVSGMSLNNNGEQLTLKDKDGNTIDTAWKDGSPWPAGSNGNIKESMERKDNPSDGTHDSEWYTCNPTLLSSDDLNTMRSYWKSDGQNNNCGTPKGENLSQNDPPANPPANP